MCGLLTDLYDEKYSKSCNYSLFKHFRVLQRVLDSSQAQNGTFLYR